MLGQKSFWKNTQDKRDPALSALAFAYFHRAIGTQEQERIATLAFETATDEYNRRSAYYITKELVP